MEARIKDVGLAGNNEQCVYYDFLSYNTNARFRGALSCFTGVWSNECAEAKVNQTVGFLRHAVRRNNQPR